MIDVGPSASLQIAGNGQYIRRVFLPLLIFCALALCVLVVRGLTPRKTVVFVIPDHFTGTVSLHVLQVHDGPIIWPWVAKVEVPIHALHGDVETSLRPLFQWRPSSLARSEDGMNLVFEDSEGRPIPVEVSTGATHAVSVHDLHSTYYGIRFSVGKAGPPEEAVSFSRGMYFQPAPSTISP